MASLQEGNLELNKYALSCLSYCVWLTLTTSVQHLVLDEADRMLDPEFLSQVQEVIAACTHPDIQKAVFSATLPAGAEKLAMGILRNPIRIIVGLKCVSIAPISTTVYTS